MDVPNEYQTILEAIDAAVDYDTVLVAPGTYVENIDFIGKAIHVMSSDGPSLTVIDGNQAGSIVTFTNYENNDSIIEGFTITNGWGAEGGGVSCDYSEEPSILNNIITENFSVGDGGGIFIASGDPIIQNNEITANETAGGGGGLMIHDTRDPLNIERNRFSSNTAANGGGIYADPEYDRVPVFSSNFIYNNTAISLGGGFFCTSNRDLSLVNETLTSNSAGVMGGGISAEEYTVISARNSIIWENEAPDFKEIHMENASLFTQFSIIRGGYVGQSILDQDPLFVDPTTGDFHLSRLSPCINRGSNAGAALTDFDGEARPCMGVVDIGADEFTGAHTLSTETILLLMNTPMFDGFYGVLDPFGQSIAHMNSFGPLPPGFAGNTPTFAFCLRYPWEFVSNPLMIHIIY